MILHLFHMVRTFLFLFLLIVFYLKGHSAYYVVYLKNKHGVEFNPYTFFDQNAIVRRQKMNLSLYDSSDFPVQQSYVHELQMFCDSIYGQSRWLNAVFVSSSDIENIKALPFVKDIIAYEGHDLEPAAVAVNDNIDLNLIQDQTRHLQGDVFEREGIRGKGIRIAVFDAGFPMVDVHPAFKHLIQNQKIIKTYDFARNKMNVYKHDSHGTAVLSCIAGTFYGQKLGLATEAEFLLAITEFGHREPFSEEKNWLLAAEWADQNGADIINSSLGYTNERYFPHDMNGKTSLVSQAARMAIRKGILVVNSAGNEGSDYSWRIIGTPADVDSVLSVGGINPYNNYRISFSSLGPTANCVLKPNVCAFGQVIAAHKKGYQETFGTSFAAPLISGFAACSWQTDTSLSNMELYQKIEESSSLYPYFDYAHGYGVPQASYFLKQDTIIKPKPTFEVKEYRGTIHVEILDDFIDTVGFENISEAVLKSIHNYLYFHIEDVQGVLREYSLIEVYSKNALEIPRYDIGPGEVLRIYYKGYLYTKTYD